MPGLRVLRSWAEKGEHVVPLPPEGAGSVQCTGFGLAAREVGPGSRLGPHSPAGLAPARPHPHPFPDPSPAILPSIRGALYLLSLLSLFPLASWQLSVTTAPEEE